MATLGTIYWEDFQDFPESIKWFEKAINAGDIKSQYWIAFPQMELGHFKLAEGAFLQAIGERNVEAVLDLAKLYLNHLQSPEKAEKVLKDHAKLGLTKAMVFLVDFYINRNQSELAKGWIEDLRRVGNAGDLASVAGILRKHGWTDLATSLTQEAADRGDRSSLLKLLTDLEKTDDKKKLFAYLDRLVSQSNKADIYALACSLDQGEMARKSVYSPSAEMLFTQLAASGHKNSFLRLANLILRDKSHDRKAEALPWFIEAAKGGSRPAQVRLCLLASSLGELDLFETWFKVALEKGLPGQNRELGVELKRLKEPQAALRAFAFEFENGKKQWAPEYAVALWQSERFSEAESVMQYVHSFEKFMVGSLGSEFMKAQNFEKATEFLLKENPRGSFRTSYCLSYSYWRLNAIQDAETYLSSAESIAAQHEETENLLDLGMMNYRLGHLEKARDQFTKLTEERELQHIEGRLIDRTRGLELLGAACFALAKKKEAVEHWLKSDALSSRACARFLAVEGREISIDEPQLEVLHGIVERQYGLSC